MIDAARSVPGGRLFWTGAVVGWAVIAFGIWGAFYEGRRIDESLAIWMVGGLLAHDLVVAPLVFACGIALRRVVGARLRAAVIAALMLSAFFVIVSIPVIGRFGARADDPTALPRNATAGLLVILSIVWIGTAIVVVVAWRRPRRT